MQNARITSSEPDERGHWDKFGGRYVPETLVAPLEELTSEFTRARSDPDFCRELNALLHDYAGRPTPLFHARRLSAHAGGAQDQQCVGTGPAGAAHGQTACYRRDRGRAARRRHGNGVRIVWIAMCH